MNNTMYKYNMFPGADLALFHFFAALIFAPETSCEWEKSWQTSAIKFRFLMMNYWRRMPYIRMQIFMVNMLADINTNEGKHSGKNPQLSAAIHTIFSNQLPDRKDFAW